MKKLLNRCFCDTLVLLCSAMYAQPCTFEDVVKKTTYDIPYKKYTAPLDMEKVLNAEKSNFLGFIGVNRKRLRITFTSIKKSEGNKNVYEVEGFSTVMNKNKRTFKGTFSLQSHYKFTEPTFEEPLKNGDIEGFSTFSYQLAEDEKLSATGIFKGEMLVLWYKRINKNPIYSNIFFYTDGERNYQFFGTWTSYKTKKASIASWGEYRIPCSGDFDGGDGTFYPDSKYWQYGWEEFRY
ncbi:hypothetical protein [Capnocytophaga genosp. AHN8471]|uniref:hypothetical protein n=1 Tax=Capnocytophaga genosp. AHN8471 TaxID=327574 RepID=UPI001EE3F300|nr:hypothetical protein [Capnocytophaga genosp. AHN8471]